MKKSFYFLLIFLAYCGPSDAEIQEQINSAVSQALEENTTTTLAPTTTTTTTTTTLAPTTTTTTTLAPTTTTTTTLAPTTTTTTTLAPTTTTTTTTTTLAPTTTTTTTIPVINDVYLGSGDNIVAIKQYNELVVAYIVGNSSDSFFAVIPYLDDRRYSSIVSTTDPYEGVTVLNFDGDNPNTLEVKADGDWSITIMSANDQRSFTDNSITGVGYAVIQFPDNKNNLQILTITGNSADDFFAVIPYDCNGNRRISLVSTTDPYSGTVRSSSGTCFLEIKAEDEWTITR